VPGILWLASYPKSGNTWLRGYLANLFLNPARPIPINELPDHAYGDNFLIHYEQLSGKKAEDLGPGEIAQLRPKVHEWLAYSKPDTVMVKTHSACIAADGVPLITPAATVGAIYVIRNPLDVVSSFANHYQTDADAAIDMMCAERCVMPPVPGQLEQVLLDWSGHVRSWMVAQDMKLHVMRYEDMTRTPYKIFAALSQFLGLPEEKDRIRRAIRFSSFKEMKKQENTGGFIEARPDGKAKFFRAGKTGAWRTDLSESQIAKIIEAHREVMTKFGYLSPQGEPLE